MLGNSGDIDVQLRIRYRLRLSSDARIGVAAFTQCMVKRVEEALQEIVKVLPLVMQCGDFRQAIGPQVFAVLLYKCFAKKLDAALPGFHIWPGHGRYRWT